MARPSLRRYDVQAKYSVIVSIAAVLPLLAAVFATLSRYQPQLRAIQYGQAGWFKLGFLMCIAAAIFLSVAGAGLGFNSAGQRRNHDQRKSWTGFFIGTGVLSITIIVLSAFWALKLEIPSG